MIYENFPRYTEFDPMIPVWCVTPDRPGCIHRFFDTSPISPSGRYLAIFQLPFEDRQPLPGEKGNICVVDLETGEDRVVADLVKMRYFAGLTLEQAAVVLGVSRRTTERYWAYARAWLYQEITKAEKPPSE